MRILGLSIENFQGYTGTHELGLADLGLVAVTGDNQDDPANDDNGAGKSTILEALTWGLWGEGLPRREGNSEKGVQADEVLNDLSPKQCRVTVSLMDEDTENTYQVARWRKWKEAKGKATSGASLAINGEVQEALDIAETNKWIRDCLGMDREIWTRSVIFGQESQFNFCEATAGDRSKILTTVLGLEKVDRWLGRCRDERKALKEESAGTAGGLEVQRRQLAAEDQLNPQVTADIWEGERDQRVEKFRVSRIALEKQGKAAKTALEALPDFTEPEPDKYVAQRTELPPAPRPVPPPPVRPVDQGLRQASVDADKAWRDQTGPAQRAQTDLLVAQRALSAAEGVTAGAICPTCKQAVTEAHRASCLAAATATLEREQAMETPLVEALGRLKAAAEAAQAAHQQDLARFEAERQAVQQAAQQANQAATEAYQEDLARFEAIQRIETQKERESWGARQAWKDRGRATAARRAQFQSALDIARMDWKQCAVREKEVAEEVNPHLAAVAAHEARIQDLRDGVLHLEAEHEGQLQQLAILDWWDKELPRFKVWMFESVTDTLAAEANRWLRIMSGGVIWIQISAQKEVGKGANKRVKDELEVTVHRWNPTGPPTVRIYRLWSGGEKRRVALAVDLGLSRLMAQRASKAYRFLALDEVDRHLDARGREGLRDVLDELRTERETCMVITHDPEFRASFDGQIRVTKQGGASSWEVQRESQAS